MKSAPDGWMDVDVVGRTGITQWTDRGSVFSRLCLSGVHPFLVFLLISGIVTLSGGGRAAFLPEALITCYVSSVENTWRKVCSGIWSGRTGHLINLRVWFISCFLFFSFFFSKFVRNVRGMKTEDGYNLGNIDHSSSQFYCLHIRWVIGRHFVSSGQVRLIDLRMDSL